MHTKFGKETQTQETVLVTHVQGGITLVMSLEQEARLVCTGVHTKRASCEHGEELPACAQY
jgi:hypothetical protein